VLQQIPKSLHSGTSPNSSKIGQFNKNPT